MFSNNVVSKERIPLINVQIFSCMITDISAETQIYCLLCIKFIFLYTLSKRNNEENLVKSILQINVKTIIYLIYSISQI
jgi:hypothetical protein